MTEKHIYPQRVWVWKERYHPKTSTDDSYQTVRWRVSPKSAKGEEYISATELRAILERVADNFRESGETALEIFYREMSAALSSREGEGK